MDEVFVKINDETHYLWRAVDHYGEVLRKNDRPFGISSSSANTFSVSAFSSGTRELVLNGLGIGWLPFSMVYREIESGALISLAHRYGQEALQVVIYADKNVEIAQRLMKFWAKEA
jgi:DNA-binding transcriptional LysR family regulator